ncbi:MAG: branched-chain amino acid ABC transporter permease [Microthrixaceae bacterium]
MVFAIIGTSVVVLTGWSGQVSLGQMVFVGVGAAVGAWCTVERGWDPFVSMMIAGPLGAVVAVVVGLPALRLRGLYLAVTTLAVSLAASEWVFSNRAVGVIPSGSFERPALFGRIALDTPMRLYYFALAVLLVVFVALRGIRRSRSGRVDGGAARQRGRCSGVRGRPHPRQARCVRALGLRGVLGRGGHGDTPGIVPFGHLQRRGEPHGVRGNGDRRFGQPDRSRPGCRVPAWLPVAAPCSLVGARHWPRSPGCAAGPARRAVGPVLEGA